MWVPISFLRINLKYSDSCYLFSLKRDPRNENGTPKRLSFCKRGIRRQIKGSVASCRLPMIAMLDAKILTFIIMSSRHAQTFHHGLRGLTRQVYVNGLGPSLLNLFDLRLAFEGRDLLGQPNGAFERSV